MAENLRPEEQLKEAREKARRLLGLDNEAAQKAAQRADARRERNHPTESLLREDHLSLFLRSLNAELRNALNSARASSQELAELAAEMQRATAHHEQPH
jgi:hypothetical protein